MQMVDIHCHILPGLDDGADTLETSIQMAEMAIADGITHVVGTPHANSQYKFDPALIRQRRDEVQAAVGDRLTLATGCDFHLSFENLQDLYKNPQKYTINQKNYLLVEFADFAIPPSMDDTMHQLQLAGLSPIITHPERNALLRTKPERMYRWLHQGSYAQITAMSLLGRFGSAAQHRADQWLDEDRVHFIATDAHNVKGRPLQLRAAYDKVVERRGEEVAQALFHDNPLAVFEGRSLPYEPEQPDPNAKPIQYRKRKRFIFF
jgi:protein-tyrosine phosphatase